MEKPSLKAVNLQMKSETKNEAKCGWHVQRWSKKCGNTYFKIFSSFVIVWNRSFGVYDELKYEFNERNGERKKQKRPRSYLKSCVVWYLIHRTGHLKIFSSYFKLTSKVRILSLMTSLPLTTNPLFWIPSVHYWHFWRNCLQ